MAFGPGSLICYLSPEILLVSLRSVSRHACDPYANFLS